MANGDAGWYLINYLRSNSNITAPQARQLAFVGRHYALRRCCDQPFCGFGCWKSPPSAEHWHQCIGCIG